MPIGTNEVQKIEMFGGPTTGTFRLQFMGQTTASSLSLTATAAQFKSALESLTTIQAGGVNVTGGPINSGAIFVEFTGKRTHEDVPLITILGSGIGGGSIGVTNTANHPGTSSLLTGAVHHWSLDESSGTRYDKIGTAHLTVGGTAAEILSAGSFFLRGVNVWGQSASPPGRLSSTNGTVFVSSSNPDMSINIKVSAIGIASGSQVYLCYFGTYVRTVISLVKVSTSYKFRVECYAGAGGGSFYSTAETPLMTDVQYNAIWSVTAKLQGGRAYIAAFQLPDSALNYGEFYPGNASTITQYDTSGDFQIQSSGLNEFIIDEVTIWNRAITQDEAYMTLLSDWAYPKSYVSFLALNGTPPTGSSYKLTYNGQSCTLAGNATQTAVATALSGLSTIGSGNITQGTSGRFGSFATPANPMCLMFTGSLAGATATDITVDNTNMIFRVTQETQGVPTTLVATKAGALPHLTISGSVIDPDRESAGTLSLPRVASSGQALGNADRSAAGVATLPAMGASGAAYTDRYATGSITVPHVVASGTAESSRSAEGSIAMPEIAANGLGTVERLAEGSIAMPSIAMQIEEIQQISASGIPTGGTWTITHESNPTGAIDFDADNTEVTSALEGLASIGSGNVSVSGGPLGVGPFVVVFQNSEAGVNQQQMTTSNSLSGVASDITITTITGGSAGTDEIQELALYGTPTGGTFGLTFGSETVSGLAHSSSSASIQAALESMSAFVPGDVVVSGGPFPGTPITVTFAQNYKSTNVGALVFSASGLTGGSIFATASTIQDGSEDFTTLSQNLLSYWRMEETSGGAIREDSFAGNDLVPVNPNVFGVTGLVGNAASFQGPASTTRLECANAGLSQANWSVSVWVRINNFSWTSATFIVFGVGAYKIEYQQQQNRFAVTKNGTPVAYSSALSGNAWYNLVLSVDFTASIPKAEFFVNGQTRGTFSPWMSAMQDTIQFGGYTSGAGSGEIHIDESALYSEGINLAKAQKLYNNGTPPAFPFLSAQNEIQQILTSGSPSRGTIKIAPYNLSGLSDTPVAVPYNATSSEVKSAIVSSSYYGSSDVNVTGGPLGSSAVNIEYIGQYAQKNVGLIYVDDSDIKSGVTQTTQGVSGTNEVQRISASPTPVSGAFVLTFGGNSTSPLAHNSSSTVIQSALRGLPSIGPSGVNVSGGPINTSSVDVTFVGPLGSTNVAQITATDTLIGSSPTISVTTIQNGAPGGTATTWLDTLAAAGTLTLPKIAAAGAALGNIDRTAMGVVLLPEITASGTAEWSNSAQADIDLPSFVFTGEALNEIVRRASGGLALPEIVAFGEVENQPELSYSGSGSVTMPSFSVMGLSQTFSADDGSGSNERQSTTSFRIAAGGQYFDEFDGKVNDIFKWSATGFEFSSRPGTGQVNPGEANRFWYKDALTMTQGQVINLDLYSFLTYNGGKGFGTDQLGLRITMDAVTMISIEQLNLDGVLLIGGATRAPWVSFLNGRARLPYGFRFGGYCRGVGGWAVTQGTNQYLRIEATQSTCIVRIRIEGRKYL